MAARDIECRCGAKLRVVELRTGESQKEEKNYCPKCHVDLDYTTKGGTTYTVFTR